MSIEIKLCTRATLRAQVGPLATLNVVGAGLAACSDIHAVVLGDGLASCNILSVNRSLSQMEGGTTYSYRRQRSWPRQW